MNKIKLAKTFFWGYYHPSRKCLCPFLATINALYLAGYCLIENWEKKYENFSA